MAKQILIVDDALIMRRRIREIAEQAGWEVVGEAADGQEALSLYEQQRPDLVTLDIVMPKMDGVATLEKIRQLDPAARVIMISAVDQRAKLAECIAHGAIDFVVKPFDAERLRKLLRGHIAAQTGSSGA